MSETRDRVKDRKRRSERQATTSGRGESGLEGSRERDACGGTRGRVRGTGTFSITELYNLVFSYP
jgi:hypothetical protein